MTDCSSFSPPHFRHNGFIDFMNRFIILSMLVALSITHPLAAALAVEVDYETTMQAIAQDIANLRSKVPELQDFSFLLSYLSRSLTLVCWAWLNE
jgi:hypothetical protein